MKAFDRISQVVVDIKEIIKDSKGKEMACKTSAGIFPRDRFIIYGKDEGKVKDEKTL